MFNKNKIKHLETELDLLKKELINLKGTLMHICTDVYKPKYKYGDTVMYSRFYYGAEATALSNTIDINKWDGQKFGEYVCTKH